MKRSIKAVIFDMDGTILDTKPIWEQSSRYILETYASHLSPSEIDSIMHRRRGQFTADERYAIIQQHCTTQLSLNEIKAKKTDYVHQVYKNEGVHFIPYFHEFHTELSKHGLKSAIATNASHDAVEMILIKTPLDKYFNEHIYTIDKVNSNYKPSPDIYFHAAQKLGVAPADCIVIEDSGPGIKAAKAAGMYCIGINTGKNRDRLHEADEIVDCYSEINLKKLITK